MKILYTILILICIHQVCFAHRPDAAAAPLKKWYIPTKHTTIEASMLMTKNGEVYLETENHEVIRVPIASLTAADITYVEAREKEVEYLNQHRNSHQVGTLAAHTHHPAHYAWWIAIFLLMLGLSALAYKQNWHKKRLITATIVLAGTALLFGFKQEIAQKILITDPLFMDAAFVPFKPDGVNTFWDDTWFYVESHGIPTHEMMTGITKWQQQVPLPQCYIGENAWQIPLNPVPSANPAPVSPQHFLRGAIAIAANGVPIFNPYTNTGVDAFLDGQLDDFGGHSGRADDYHYHTAPLHLDAITPEILPIAFGLDGYPIYGSLEPDGSPMTSLDANHGHMGANGIYHYHGTAQAPYMIAKMYGQVTEDATLQIIPQPKATPVRPSLTPLNGAAITDCTPNGTNNGYNLSYTLNGATHQVNYSWTPNGVYTYQFVSPTGTTTSTYNGFMPCEVPTTSSDTPSAKESPASIFPNPTVDGFTIQLKDNQSISDVESIELLGLEGKRKYFNTSLSQPTILLTNLSKGVYMLHIKTKKGQWSEKILHF